MSRALLLLSLAACGDGAKVPIGDSGGDTAPGDTAEDCAPVPWYADADGDGFGADGTAESACASPGAGWAARGGDCDDADPAVFPGAAEACNGVDDDCDGTGDADFATWYADADGDGYGDVATGVETCLPEAGRVADGTDCDDADATVHPGAQEVCGDGDDDDCDGAPDVSAAAQTWHPDADGDGYGHMYDGESTCDPPAGWVLDATDCRPSDAEAHPGAAERCNDDDDDCDREVDEGMDADGDGHRNDLCDDGDDCDDADPGAYPGNPDDTCEDGIDQDCDGVDRPCDFWGEYLLADATKLHATSASEDAGRLLDVGDATGDGVNDLFVATYTAEAYGGGGYLVPGPISTSGALESAGYALDGDVATTYGAGRSIGIGDVDGDGVADLAFGVPYHADNGLYVLLGPIAADADVEDADCVLLGTSGTYAGHGGDLGDVDGDGIADAVVGAYYTGGATGTVYVQYGPFDAEVDLASDADVILDGEGPGYYTGRHVHVGGDVDGDGVGDFLVAAPYATGSAPTSGIVYLVYGPGNVGDMSGADARLLGETGSAYAGNGAAMSAGDVDGDGLDDVAVGALRDSSAGMGTGSAYVVFGPASGDVDLGSADVIVRGDASSSTGTGVALGDVGADGTADLLVGSSDANATAGGAYLFLAPPAGTYALSDADARFVGETAVDAAGSYAALGDVSGDGLPEVLLGATGESTGGSGAGAVYVSFPEG